MAFVKAHGLELPLIARAASRYHEFAHDRPMQDSAAVAKLYDLDQEHEFDLLVLDTPPSRNALDFLEAPQRLSSFLDGTTLKALARPAGRGIRVLGRSATPLLAALRRVTGVDLLTDLGTFFGLLGDMTGDFTLRARQVDELLHADTTAFVLVTSAEREPIEEAIWFHRTLEHEELPFAGVVVNRVHHDLLDGSEPEDVRPSLRRTLGADLAARVAENFRDYHVLARRDDGNVSRLARALGDEPLLVVPQLDDDVHDLEGLLRMHRYLFASAPEREQLIANLVA